MHSKAIAALDLMNKLNLDGAIKPNLDYSATQQAFVNRRRRREHGRHVDDRRLHQRIREGRLAAQKGGYTVVPFANIFGKKAAFADGAAGSC